LDEKYIEEIFKEQVSDYKEKIAHLQHMLDQINNSVVQLKILDDQLKDFISVSIKRAKNIFESDPEHKNLTHAIDGFMVLQDSLNQAYDLISDRPDLILLEIQKVSSNIQILETSKSDLNILKEKIYAREADLKELEDELKKNDNKPLRRKVGKRPRKTKDVRNTKAKIESENDSREEQNEK